MKTNHSEELTTLAKSRKENKQKGGVPTKTKQMNNLKKEKREK